MIGTVRIGLDRQARRDRAGRGVERSRCHHLCKTKPIFPGLKTTVNTYGNSSYDRSSLLGRKESEANFGSGWRREAGRRTTEDGGQRAEDRRRGVGDGTRLARYERRATRHRAKQSQLARFGAGNEGMEAPSGRFLRLGGVGVRMERNLANSLREMAGNERRKMEERLIRSGCDGREIPSQHMPLDI